MATSTVVILLSLGRIQFINSLLSWIMQQLSPIHLRCSGSNSVHFPNPKYNTQLYLLQISDWFLIFQYFLFNYQFLSLCISSLCKGGNPDVIDKNNKTECKTTHKPISNEFWQCRSRSFSLKSLISI